jgi:hypothetical protein
MPIPTYSESLLLLLAILQRTATAYSVVPKTVDRNQLIDSGMPPFVGPLTLSKACIGSMRNWLQRKT